ncbi:MAG: endolytic transglycosylase MltG [Chitinophagales bacterium]
MKRIFITLFTFVLILALLLAWMGYKVVYSPNIQTHGEKTYFYIPSIADYEQVKILLSENELLIDEASFDLLARKMNYPSHVYPGRYELRDGMSNRKLILLLRSGEQAPVKLILKKVRRVEEVAEIAAAKLELNQDDLLQVLLKPGKNEVLGNFNKENILSLFIPDTYEFYWNTDAETFLKRMLREYNNFWTDERKAAAKAQGLSPDEVIALASIVEEESNKDEERPIIAGLYLNRLNRGMLLQADPTVRFALGDFEIRRVLTKHLKTDSPYNTYLYKGLPPGPICTPSKKSIEAVLHPKEHNYLYMCAKADFSGYHEFASTLNEHLKNARKFQKALNENKIYN